MKNPYFGRLLTAMVTPFNADGSVNYEKAADLAEWLINNGSDGLVVAGSTGEAATMSAEEKLELFRVVVNRINKRVPVIAGTGSNNTADSVKMTKMAEAMGVDGALIVGPYYNKPTQEGLYRHFKTIAEAVDIPVILYNVPGRTVADMSNETTLRLAQIPNIVGIKDATGGFDRACDLIARAPKDFAIYSGDDASAVALMLMGGKGNVSVVANIAPRLMHEMCVAALAGDLAKARELHFRMLGLHRQLFCEANPIPVKWACAQLGLTEAGIRLPLTPLSKECHERVLGAMRQAGLSV